MTDYISLTWEEFQEQFKPLLSPFGNDDSNYNIETYGEELQYVVEQDPHYVWTYTDVGNGTGIYNGYHWVNRLAYIVTEVPWVEGTEYEVDLDLDTCEECDEVIEMACQEDDGELTCTNCCGHEECQ